MNYLEATATISPCGLYRYALTRLWNPERETVVFCMLNPSTADGSQDDPTIRRCVGFADAWGYGQLVVVNLFALRATDPEALRKAMDPVGPDNDRHLAAESAGRLTVCAWGSTVAKWPRPLIRERPAVARKAMPGAFLRHLGLTKDKHPKHPLYLKGDATPLEFAATPPRMTVIKWDRGGVLMVGTLYAGRWHFTCDRFPEIGQRHGGATDSAEAVADLERLTGTGDNTTQGAA